MCVHVCALSPREPWRSGRRGLPEDAGPGSVCTRVRQTLQRGHPARAPAAAAPWAGVSLIPREGARTRLSDFTTRGCCPRSGGDGSSARPGIRFLEWLTGWAEATCSQLSPSRPASPPTAAQLSPARLQGHRLAPFIKESTSVSNQSCPRPRPVDGPLFPLLD